MDSITKQMSSTVLGVVVIVVVIGSAFIAFVKHDHAQEKAAAIRHAQSDPSNLQNAKSCETINVDPEKSEAGDVTGYITVVDYGNGVFYFPCGGAPFLKTLSKYLEKHSDLQVTAMASGIATDFLGNSYAPGYYVTFGKKYQ